MSGKGRPVFQLAFKQFLKSFRPRQIKGDLKGEDYFGNKFFEIPADPANGRRKNSRWFEPPEVTDLDHGHEITGEWESWLRGRR
jgi:NADH dehydrogenase [ubiquinone] 1 alpha subcomplex assembly factor 2